MSISHIAARTLVVGIALAAGPAALAQTPYVFTNVIDTTIDPNVGGNEGLALDGDTVAIHNLNEIYTMTGGVRTTIAKVGDSTPAGSIENFDVFGTVTLSGANVAFIAETSGGAAVLYGSGGPLTKVAREGDMTPEGQISFIPQDTRASISGGNVAFTADIRPSLTSAVFVSSGGVLTTIAPPAPTITHQHWGPALTGNRAAYQERNFSDMAIYSGTGGSLTTIVKVGDPAPEGTFLSGPPRVPEISGDVVAFNGFYGSGSQGIFTGNGGPLTTIVKEGDAPSGIPLT
jgi:hypothetical protein